MLLEYKIGDVRFPEESRPFIIPHCVNDCPGGVMGAGVAAALFNKWPEVKELYHRWAQDETFEDLEVHGCEYLTGPFRLGEVQIIKVATNVYVANMVGQRNTWDVHGIPPIRYEAIRDCLWNLRDWLETRKRRINICSPKFGAGLSGGNFDKIEKIILEIFKETNFSWTIYSLR